MAGKINHASHVIPCIRLFCARILESMCGKKESELIKITCDIKADLAWITKFGHELNARTLMIRPPPTRQIFADSCLLGGGGHDDERFYEIKYSDSTTKADHISQLEAVNSMLSVRALSEYYPKDTHIELFCDNMATILTFSGFKGKD